MLNEQSGRLTQQGTFMLSFTSNYTHANKIQASPPSSEHLSGNKVSEKFVARSGVWSFSGRAA